VHAPPAEFNEEQHIKTSEPERLHDAEVAASIDAIAVEVPPKVPGSPFYL
jgi:hypothetical protein